MDAILGIFRRGGGKTRPESSETEDQNEEKIPEEKLQGAFRPLITQEEVDEHGKVQGYAFFVDTEKGGKIEVVMSNRQLYSLMRRTFKEDEGFYQTVKDAVKDHEQQKTPADILFRALAEAMGIEDLGGENCTCHGCTERRRKEAEQAAEQDGTNNKRKKESGSAAKTEAKAKKD